MRQLYLLFDQNAAIADRTLVGESERQLVSATTTASSPLVEESGRSAAQQDASLGIVPRIG